MAPGGPNRASSATKILQHPVGECVGVDLGIAAGYLAGVAQEMERFVGHDPDHPFTKRRKLGLALDLNPLAAGLGVMPVIASATPTGCAGERAIGPGVERAFAGNDVTGKVARHMAVDAKVGALLRWVPAWAVDALVLAIPAIDTQRLDL